MEPITEFNIQYIDFNKYLAPAQYDTYITTPYYRTFNPSIVKIDNDTFLYSVRIRSQSKKRPNEDRFIPGNDQDCTNKENVGYNFWWNNWFYGADRTIFVIGNHTKNDFRRMKIIKNEKWGSNFYPYREITNYYVNDGDIRLVKINDKIYLHSNNLKFVLEVTPNKITNEIVVDQAFTQVTTNQGQNQQIVDIIKDEYGDEKVMFLDWYYKKIGVTFGLSNPYEFNRVKYYWIKFEKFIIDGKGSHVTGLEDDIKVFGTNYGITPLLSFGTPHLHITHKTYGNLLLGVGHIKIHSDTTLYKYAPGSNIDSFRNNLYQDMRSQFGDKYIKHFGSGRIPDCTKTGYIYMMYFYIIYDKNTNNEYQQMRLSNGYLPILLDKKIPDNVYDLDYKFSLIFPTGLERINPEKIVIVAGEGDFYSVGLEFKLDEAINLCKHDVKNTDMRTYEYNIIAKKDNRIFVDSKLSNIIAKSNLVQSGGSFYWKQYLKYKQKYLNFAMLRFANAK